MTKPDRPARNPWKTVALASLTVAVASFAIAVVAVALTWDRTNQANDEASTARAAAATAQAAADQLLAQRTEARVNTCLKDKKFAEAHNALVERDKALVVAIATDAGRRAVSVGDQAAVDHELSEYDKRLVAVPDCTPPGIAAFYAGQGGTVAPATPAAPVMPSTTSTTKARSKRATTTTTVPTTSTGRPSSTTSTTFRSSPTTTPTPCTGVPLPGGLPCL